MRISDWSSDVCSSDLQWLDDEKTLNEEGLRKKILEAADAIYREKEAQVGADSLRQFERAVMLQSMDTHWREHLSALDHLRQGIHQIGRASCRERVCQYV